MKRTSIVTAVVLQVLFLTGCSSSEDSSFGVIPPGVVAGFVASPAAPAADLVRIRGVGASGNVVTVDVAISGPTSSGDIYSFAFDLVLSDPTVASYVTGSARVGTALVPAGGQGSIVLVSQNGNRVIVAVSKSEGGAGNAVGGSEEAIVRLDFLVLRAGTTDLTLAGQDPSSDPAALDSTGSVIPGVTFDQASARLTGI